MGEKRHFEPVKRAEPRFPENPTNHSSPPARRRQKIAPLRHSSPPLRPSRPHRHLPTSFAHSVCLIPLPFFHIRPSLADTDPTMSNTTIHHSILFTFPDSSVFHLSLLRGIAVHNSHPFYPPLLWIRHHNSFNPSFGKTPKRHNLDIIPTTQTFFSA